MTSGKDGDASPGAVTLSVKLASKDGVDSTQLIEFDGRPLEEQVQKVCGCFSVLGPAQGVRRVFTQGLTAGAPLVRTELQLLMAPAGGTLGLHTVGELTRARLGALQVAIAEGRTGKEIAHRTRGVLAIIQKDVDFSNEVMNNEGLALVLQAAQCGGPAVEASMSCFCELFRNDPDDRVAEWLEKNQQDAISATLFQHLFAVLFPDGSGASSLKKEASSMASPRASLFSCVFFLHSLYWDVTAVAAHEAAMRFSPGHIGYSAPFYQRIVDAIEGDDAFQVTAAVAVLSTLANSVSLNDQLQADFKKEVAKYADAESICHSIVSAETADLQDSLIKCILSSSLNVCADSGTSRSGDDGPDAELEKQSLQRRLAFLQADKEKLKADLRTRHSQMHVMRKFMKLEKYPAVEQVLDGIIRKGWDSIAWRKGYTILHYACECIDDPAVVELVGLLATTVNSRDASGLTPLDYAKRSNNKRVMKIIRKLLLREQQMQSGVSAGDGQRKVYDPELDTYYGVGDASNQEHGAEQDDDDDGTDGSQLQLLKARLRKAHLEPKLERAVKTTLLTGWDNLQWVGNNTAMHMAAREGSLEAISILLAARADAGVEDDCKLTPLDYAAQQGHAEVVAALRPHLQRGAVGSQGVASPGSPSGDAAGSNQLPRAPGSPSQGSPSGRPPPPPSPGGSPAATDVMDFSGDAAATGLGPPRSKLKTPAEPPGPAGVGSMLPMRELSEEERKNLLIPVGLDPALEKACADVVQKGWGQMSFAKNFTPLHLAAKTGSKDAIMLLLEASARPGLEIRDFRGYTPLDYASKKGFMDVQPLLDVSKASSTSPAAAQPPAASGVPPPGARLPGPPGPTSGRPPPPAPMGILPGAPPSSAGGDPSSPGTSAPGSPAGVAHSWLAGQPTPGAMDGGQLQHTDGRAGAPALPQHRLSEMHLEMLRLREENASLQKRFDEAAPAQSGLQGPLSAAAVKKFSSDVDELGQDGVAAKLGELGGLQGDALTQALLQVDRYKRLLEAEKAANAASGAGATGKGGKAGPPGKGAKKGDASGQDDRKEEEKKDVTADGKGGKKGKAAPPAKGEKGKGPAAPAKGKGPPGKGKAPGPKGGATKGGKGSKGGKGAVAAGAPGAADENTEPQGPEYGKPKRTPSVPMKALWWNKLQFDIQLVSGETVWDLVEDETDNLPIPELEARFGKNAAAAKAKPKAAKEEKKEKIQTLRIITDPNLVVGKEASLSKVPPAQTIARALQELNEDDMDLDVLHIIKEHACPDGAQMQQLAELRQKHPDIPLALPEQYMWVIGNIPASKQRLDCWGFVRTYEERHESYAKALDEIRQVIDCFFAADMLPSLLGVVLAVGNWLNGGTNRGQADGFDLETLGKLDAVKDAAGKDLRSYIFEVFFTQYTEEAEVLLQQLGPCLMNVNRRLSKDSDGTEKLGKSARWVFEDFDQCVSQLQAEYTAQHETMQMILQCVDDPADAFRVKIPDLFAEAKRRIDGLVGLKDGTKDAYQKLLKWFKVSGMKSSEFCLIWDNFLISADLIMNAADKVKKEIYVPAFCQQKPVKMDHLLMLWGLKDPEEKKSGGAGAAKDKEKDKAADKHNGRKSMLIRNQNRERKGKGKGKGKKGGTSDGIPPADGEGGGESQAPEAPALSRKGKAKAGKGQPPAGGTALRATSPPLTDEVATELHPQPPVPRGEAPAAASQAATAAEAQEPTPSPAAADAPGKGKMMPCKGKVKGKPPPPQPPAASE